MTIARYRKPAGSAPARLGDREAKVIEAAQAGSVQVAKAELAYSDLIDGQAVAAGDIVPEGALVVGFTVQVSEAFAGDGDGSSEISLTLAGSALDDSDLDADFLASTGVKARSISPFAASQAAQVSAELDIKATDTEVTAGKATFIVHYITI